LIKVHDATSESCNDEAKSINEMNHYRKLQESLTRQKAEREIADVSQSKQSSCVCNVSVINRQHREQRKAPVI